MSRIKQQTFIKNISDKHHKILVKIGKEFNLITTPTIIWFLLDKFYDDQKLISSQEKEIQQLKSKLNKSTSEVISIKNNLKGIFQFINK